MDPKRGNIVTTLTALDAWLKPRLSARDDAGAGSQRSLGVRFMQGRDWKLTPACWKRHTKSLIASGPRKWVFRNGKRSDMRELSSCVVGGCVHVEVGIA
jgi:hypothetical protein